jgi:hypothetical protein
MDIDFGTRIEVAEEPSLFNPNPQTAFFGKYIDNEDTLMVFGVRADKNERISYKPGHVFNIVYLKEAISYCFSTKLLAVEEASLSELGTMAELLTETANPDGYKIVLLKLMPVSMPHRYQRRSFFRISVRLPIHYRIVNESNMGVLNRVNDDNAPSESGEAFAQMMTVNISGGGFKCRINQMFPPNTLLECRVVVGKEALPFIASIIESMAYEPDQNLFEIRAKFINTDEEVRDKLLKYLFLVQREQQKRLMARLEKPNRGF